MILLVTTRCQNPNKQSVQYSDIIAVTQRVSKLYTAEVIVSKEVFMSSELVAKIIGNQYNIGEKSILLPYKIKVKAYIDFNKVGKDNFQVYTNQIEVNLPSPEIEITSIELDFDNIKRNVSWYRKDFSSKEIDSLSKYALKGLQWSDNETFSLMQEAEINAKRTITKILTDKGWNEDNIEIIFDKNYILN
ncbi:MAG: DUF4230 domain-containing protein [Bacteroidales bacterium]|nr:DUF4230 domain-containing protein [Bacteroidales bacterium]